MMKSEHGMDKRVKKTKNALKDSLISLMQEKDFRDISVTDIVETADVNRGTFYRHFQYKEELLDELIDEVLTDLIRSYRDPYEKVEVFHVGEMSASAIKIFEHVAAHASFYTMIIKSNALPGFQNRICLELKKLYLHELFPKDGRIKVNEDLMASYHSYALFGMIIEWVDGGYAYSPGYMADQLLSILHLRMSEPVYVNKAPDGFSGREK